MIKRIPKERKMVPQGKQETKHLFIILQYIYLQDIIIKYFWGLFSHCVFDNLP